jgi:hypothetical protein
MDMSGTKARKPGVFSSLAAARAEHAASCSDPSKGFAPPTRLRDAGRYWASKCQGCGTTIYATTRTTPARTGAAAARPTA